jgi:excisionase family DNA binding protein
MNDLDKQDMIYDGLERITDAARFLGVSRSQVYKLIATGLLPSVKIGSSRRVPIRAVLELASNHLILIPTAEEDQKESHR